MEVLANEMTRKLLTLLSKCAVPLSLTFQRLQVYAPTRFLRIAWYLNSQQEEIRGYPLRRRLLAPWAFLTWNLKEDELLCFHIPPNPGRLEVVDLSYTQIKSPSKAVSRPIHKLTSSELRGKKYLTIGTVRSCHKWQMEEVPHNLWPEHTAFGQAIDYSSADF